MGVLQPSFASFPNVRKEFQQLAAKANSKTLKRRVTRREAFLYTIGLFGLTLCTMLMVFLPAEEPLTVEELLRRRFTALSRYKSNKLLWSGELLNALTGYETESMKSYGILLMNHLNSRRVVDVIQREYDLISNRGKCRRVLPDCPLHPRYLRIWSPRHCKSRHSVAIIIPYRMREKQLRLLLQHLPTILKRQQINYSIFVVEQTGNLTFNKGILMNAGFLTALTRPAHGVIFHCFIFHDVDLLAEDDRNLYTCPQRPRHLSVAVDELGYELPYSELAGGVFAIRTDQFLEVNGYSNSYWGWGGEDDDMGLRVKFVFGQALRPIEEFGRYTSIWHPKLTPSLPLRVRRRLKRMTRSRYKGDGLNTVKYKLVRIEQKRQYTHILIDVGQPPNLSDLEGIGTSIYELMKPKLTKRFEAHVPITSGPYAKRRKLILESRYRARNVSVLPYPINSYSVPRTSHGT